MKGFFVSIVLRKFLKTHRRAVGGVGLLLVCLLLFSGYERFFTTNEVEVVILKKDLPKTCRKWSSALQGPKRRSAVPENSSYYGYCGMLVTSAGNFHLPNSKRFHLFGQSRENLFDSLVVGCSYKLATHGFADPYKAGDLPRNYSNRSVHAIIARMGCQ